MQLRGILPDDWASSIRYTSHIEGTGITLFSAACKYDLEGIVAKRKDSRYGQTSFEKAVATAKLDEVCFHTLRHTCASQLVMNASDLATVKQILRHKDHKTTLRYSHLSQRHMRAAVEALAAALTTPSHKEEKVS